MGVPKPGLRNPTPEDLYKIFELVRNGVSMINVARYFDMTLKTFEAARKRNPKIEEQVQKGKAAAEAIVAGKLWEIIQNPDHKNNFAAICFYLKTQCRWRETERKEDNQDTNPLPGKIRTKVLSKK